MPTWYGHCGNINIKLVLIYYQLIQYYVYITIYLPCTKFQLKINLRSNKFWNKIRSKTKLIHFFSKVLS